MAKTGWKLTNEDKVGLTRSFLARTGRKWVLAYQICYQICYQIWPERHGVLPFLAIAL